MPDTKLFISHAASDKPLATAFVDLLEGGIGVPMREIFCSSLKGQGIAPGANFVSSIRDHLDEATCVIALLSTNFYGSAFCMCELGGVWIQSKSLVPVLIPPNGYNDLKAVLNGLQATRIAVPEDLDELRDVIIERLGIEPHPTPRWSARRDKFLAELPVLLQRLPDETPVSRTTYMRQAKELASYQSEYVKLQDELSRHQAIITDLQKLKDKKEIAAIIGEHTKLDDAFNAHTAEIRGMLSALPSCVRQALYHDARGEDYSPKGEDEWDDVRTAVEEGQLKLNSDENGVRPDESDSKVQEAMMALSDLERWLQKAPVEFFEWYQAQYEGKRPEMHLRPFWREHLL